MPLQCGHEFCYVCGTSYTRAARARRAQAGCECALWDEENLLDEDGNQEAQAGQANLAPPVHFAVGAHVQRRQRQGEPLLQLRHDDDDETSSEEDDFEAIRGPWPVQSELEEQQERQQNLYNTPAEQRWVPAAQKNWATWSCVISASAADATLRLYAGFRDMLKLSGNCVVSTHPAFLETAVCSLTCDCSCHSEVFSGTFQAHVSPQGL